VEQCNHSFVPRYDEIPPSAEDIQEICFYTSRSDIETFFPLLTKRIYVGDICTWCGHFVRREPNGS
jgi:hypothetical protein